jgi:hypothetical protein
MTEIKQSKLYNHSMAGNHGLEGIGIIAQMPNEDSENFQYLCDKAIMSMKSEWYRITI